MSCTDSCIILGMCSFVLRKFHLDACLPLCFTRHVDYDFLTEFYVPSLRLMYEMIRQHLEKICSHRMI